MKPNFMILLTGLLFAPMFTMMVALTSFAGMAFLPESVGVFSQYQNLFETQDDRLIEPTSPILGKTLVAAIKADPRHPEYILRDILRQSPQIIRDIEVSTLAYLSVLEKGLDDYCDPQNAEKYAANRSAMTIVETAAIPLEILKPFHEDYVKVLSGLIAQKDDPAFLSALSQRAKDIAVRFQNKRNTCYPAQKLNGAMEKAKKTLPGRWDRLMDVNKKLSSAEAAYPRIQFSINGLTQFVYDELLAMDSERLNELLFNTFNAENDWMREARKGVFALTFFQFVERRLLSRGFSAREALLALSYSTRNMPSLDTQYGKAPLKSLMLEVYFWKFNIIRDEIQEGKYLKWMFPDYEFKEDPGFYHFATAALTACEVYSEGFSGFEARFISFMGKFGYKMNKLIKQVKDNKHLRKKLMDDQREEDAQAITKNLFKIAKSQGFDTGVKAGIFGGRHGLRACKFDREARAKRLKALPEILSLSKDFEVSHD